MPAKAGGQQSGVGFYGRILLTPHLSYGPDHSPSEQVGVLVHLKSYDKGM